MHLGDAKITDFDSSPIRHEKNVGGFDIPVLGGFTVQELRS